MSSRLIALTAIATLALGACAHDGPDGAVPSIFEQLVTRNEEAPPVVEPASASVHIAANQSYGEPTVVPVGLVGPKAVAATDGPYLLDTGDRLRIFVYGQPNLSRSYTVDHQGQITVPLIGEVKARGLTTTHLENNIKSRLGSQFVRDPQVTVDITQNRPFFILGEVRAAGQFPFVSGMTVETAVAIAGGYGDRASERKVRVTRRVGASTEIFDVTPDSEIEPGDTVYVYERFF